MMTRLCFTNWQSIPIAAVSSVVLLSWATAISRT